MAATVGILALQGDVREHEAAFGDLGAPTRRVLRPADLAGLDGIVLPGGESTTLSLLLTSSGLFEPLAQGLADGLAVFGTCAGLVLLATEVEDGRADQRSFGRVHCRVRRNGYGRQRFSFETLLDGSTLDTACSGGPAVPGAGEPLPAVFIRAPRVLEVGPEVEVLATLATDGGAPGGDPVVCREGRALTCAFHPELTGDRRLHALFTAML